MNESETSGKAHGTPYNVLDIQQGTPVFLIWCVLGHANALVCFSHPGLQLTKACIYIYLFSCTMNSKYNVQLVNDVPTKYVTRRLPTTDNWQWPTASQSDCFWVGFDLVRTSTWFLFFVIIQCFTFTEIKKSCRPVGNPQVSDCFLV